MKSYRHIIRSQLKGLFLFRGFGVTAYQVDRAAVPGVPAYGFRRTILERLNSGTGTMNGAYGLFKIAILVCLIVLTALCGCAPMTSDTQRSSRSWRCDRTADAAVDAGEWTRALALHDALLANAPDNCLALYHRGYIHGILGQRAEEIRDYLRSIACGNDGDDQLYFNLGMAYMDDGRLVDAAKAFTRAGALSPDNPENHFGLAMVRLELDNTDGAIAALHRVLDRDPNHVNGRMAMVRVLLDAGKFDEIEAHLQILRQLKPDDASVQALQRQYEERRATTYD